MSAFPTRILLATDGSEEAALAAHAAIDLSGRAGAKLHVVHTWQDLRPPTLPAMAMDEYSQAYEQYEREARELLEEQAQPLRSAGGTVAGTHLKKGRPAEEIAYLAQELEADLVVVGSRGLGSVKRLVVGSVSERVVQLDPCPTLVVRGGEGSWPPSRVIVGDDASEEARRAGEVAAGIGPLFDARTLLVRVYPQVTVFKARRISHVRASKELLREGERSLERRAAEAKMVATKGTLLLRLVLLGGLARGSVQAWLSPVWPRSQRPLGRLLAACGSPTPVGHDVVSSNRAS